MTFKHSCENSQIGLVLISNSQCISSISRLNNWLKYLRLKIHIYVWDDIVAQVRYLAQADYFSQSLLCCTCLVSLLWKTSQSNHDPCKHLVGRNHTFGGRGFVLFYVIRTRLEMSGIGTYPRVGPDISQILRYGDLVLKLDKDAGIHF